MTTHISPTQQIVNRYLLVDQIGSGGMGVVYRAIDRLSGQTVAFKHVEINPRRIKTRSSRHGKDPRLSLTQEFQTLASLRHPNIISVLDYGFDEAGQPYFTMNLLENAVDICEAGKNGGDRYKVHLLIQVLQALSYLHRRGIVHRDLKPGNVLVTPEHQVKVLDFGLAMDRQQETETVGTLSYMSPEVLQSETTTGASDLYAVGLIAYELFAGRHPYNTRKVIELLKDILLSSPDLSKLPVLDAPVSPDAPTLQAIIGKLLQASPANRYQYAYDVIVDLSAAIGQSAPRESAAIRESYLQAAEFVGREHELDQLVTALDQAASGQGSGWLIGGESGVGKTRLLNELRTRALVDGFMVLHGHSEMNSGLPYKLWREPVRHLLLSTSVDDLDASILREVVPDISTLLGRPVPLPPETERPAAQQRLIRSMVYLFRQQTRPILMLLEDLHWSNESIPALHQINQIVGELPLLIVGTYRDDERPELAEALPEMNHLKLERLSSKDIVRLSESILGEVGTQPHVVDLLQRETEGNVFFLVEVVRTLAEDVGTLHDVGRITLPEHVVAGGIQQIVNSRLDRVPVHYRPLLNAAGIAGRTVDLNILGAIDPEIDLDDWITSCANAAVLEVMDGKWYFSHEKLREALLNSMEELEKIHLHLQVARAIEKVYPDAPGQVLALAYHYNAAHDHQQAAKYAALAGEQQLQRSVYNKSIDWTERALTLGLKFDIQRAPALKWNLANAHWGIGNYAQAEQFYLESLEGYRRLNNHQGIAQALTGLSDVTRRRGALTEANTYVEEALEISRHIGDPIGTAQALGRLGVIARNRGQYKDAEAHYQEALHLYETSGETARIAGVYSGLALIAIDQGQYAKAREYYEKSLSLSREIGNRTGTALILTGLAWALYLQGDYAEAKRYSEESLAISREAGDRWMTANNLGNLGKICIELDNLVAAWHYFDEALTIAIAIDSKPLFLEILPGIGKILMQTDRQALAVVILVFSLHHPATYNEVKYQATPLLAELEAILPKTDFEAAKSRGKNSDQDDILYLIRKVLDT